MTETVWLQRPNADIPWGFRLTGGRDYQEPLRVQRVTPGSVASTGLGEQDLILRIGDNDTSCLTYNQAMEIIKDSGDMLQLFVARGGSQGYQSQQTEPLEQQMSNMNVSSDYGQQNSYPGAQTNAASPPSYSNYSSHSPQGYGQPRPQAQPAQQHQIPDAVLNMAAKGGPDKKPFTYTPDITSIQEQRDKVRRRTAQLPRYQHALNLPQFDERCLNTPKSPPTHEPPSGLTGGGYSPGPGTATVAHLQYNSPLQLYSEENVEETFKGQTDGIVTGISGVKKDDKHIIQSPVYRMIHGLDQPQPKPRVNVEAHGVRQQPRGPSEDDEVTFSGVNRPTEIPSKSFHKLQQMTADSEVDTTSIRHNVTGLEAPVGDYDQTSIRYTGRNIPSKSFRMLQHLTGGDDGDIPDAPPVRRQRKQPEMRPEPHQQNPDDVVDISYVGGTIPSRSFKMLQQSMGSPVQHGGQHQTAPDASQTPWHVPEPPEPAMKDMEYSGKAIPSRSFQLVQSAYGQDDSHALATERRRRKRAERQDSKTKEEEEIMSPHEDNFDEDAYLAGAIPLNVSGTGTVPKVSQTVILLSQSTPGEEEGSQDALSGTQEDFDEEAYLKGQIPLLGGEKKTIIPERPPEQHAPWEKDEEEQKPFDEAAYLAGQVPIMGGEPRRPSKPYPLYITQDEPHESEDRPEDPNYYFDEAAYLSGNVTVLGSSPKPFPAKALPKEEHAPWEKEQEEKPFDEDAYLAGKVPIVNEEPKHHSRHDELPTWVKKQQDETDDVNTAFEEDEYLTKKIIVLRTDSKGEAPCTTSEEEHDEPHDEKTFDEKAYLSGQIAIFEGDATGIPRADKDKPEEDLPEWAKRRRDKIKTGMPQLFKGPVVTQVSKPNIEDEESMMNEDFDEDAYLAGKIPLLRGSTDSTGTPRASRNQSEEPQAPWLKDDDSGVITDEDFDEDAYLKGRIPLLRQSVEKELPPRVETKKPYREKAPWERADPGEEPVVSNGYFDEDAYLAGRVPAVRNSVERDMPNHGGESPMAKIPSKAFTYLRRSVSKEHSPPRSRSSSFQRGVGSQSAPEDDQTTAKPYEEMVYVGKKIPSKTFLRLKQSVSKPKDESSSEDPLERLREKEGLDVEDAVNEHNIDRHDPDKYLEILKQSVEGTDIKIEGEDEVTDF